jgi:hypothetical protein
MVLFCNIVIWNIVGQIGPHEVSLEAGFFVELGKTIGSQNGSTGPEILNFEMFMAAKSQEVTKVT